MVETPHVSPQRRGCPFTKSGKNGPVNKAINLAGSPLGRFTAVVAVLSRQLAVPDADGQAAQCELLVLA